MAAVESLRLRRLSSSQPGSTSRAKSHPERGEPARVLLRKSSQLSEAGASRDSSLAIKTNRCRFDRSQTVLRLFRSPSNWLGRTVKYSNSNEAIPFMVSFCRIMNGVFTQFAEREKSFQILSNSLGITALAVTLGPIIRAFVLCVVGLTATDSLWANPR